MNVPVISFPLTKLKTLWGGISSSDVDVGQLSALFKVIGSQRQKKPLLLKVKFEVVSSLD